MLYISEKSFSFRIARFNEPCIIIVSFAYDFSFTSVSYRKLFAWRQLLQEILLKLMEIRLNCCIIFILYIELYITGELLVCLSARLLYFFLINRICFNKVIPLSSCNIFCVIQYCYKFTENLKFMATLLHWNRVSIFLSSFWLLFSLIWGLFKEVLRELIVYKT